MSTPSQLYLESQSLQQQRISGKSLIMNRVDRLEFIPYLLQRWDGFAYHCLIIFRNYNIAVFTHKREIKSTIRLIKSMNLPDRVRIILYIPRRSRDIKGVYPVNKLRNIAIVNTITTHFLVMDMDMWPARTPFTFFVMS